MWLYKFKASILSLFRDEFNESNDTEAQMLDSVYHMTLILKSRFWLENVKSLPYGVYLFYCMTLYPPRRATPCDKVKIIHFPELNSL